MIDDERRAGLNQIKLDSLLRNTFPDSKFEYIQTQSGALRSNDRNQYLYAPSEKVSPLAFALTFLDKGAAINIILDEPESLLLHQATGLLSEFTFWVIDEDELIPHPKSETEEELENLEVNPTIASLLQTNGCDVVRDHGVTKGVIKGLEVARIVEGSDNESNIQIGVGHYDQEAHKLVDRKESPSEKLARVASEVLQYRNKEAQPHPLNRIARPKWLISEIITSPEILGIEEARHLSAPDTTKAITETTPAAALGTVGNKVVLIIASVGVDLKAVPIAAGLSTTTEPDEIWMVLPEKDKHPALMRQAEHLKTPVHFKTAEEPWPT